MLTGFAGDVPTVELMRKQQTLKGLIVGSREQQQDKKEGTAGKIEVHNAFSFVIAQKMRLSARS